MTHFTRAEWGGRPAEARYRLYRPLVRGIALHWPAMASPLRTPAQVMAALRSWQDYHMDTRGWSDIAYQVAIDQLGNTYGLRGLRYRSAANGSAYVNQRYGALLLVVASGEQPSPELVQAVRNQVRVHREVFPSSKLIVGHKDVRPEPTACPGPAVSRLITSGAFTPHREDTPHQ